MIWKLEIYLGSKAFGARILRTPSFQTTLWETSLNSSLDRMDARGRGSKPLPTPAMVGFGNGMLVILCGQHRCDRKLAQ